MFKLVSKVCNKLFRPQTPNQIILNEDKLQPIDLSVHEMSPMLKIIPRNQHNISRKDISENALKVLYRLNKHGYDAYLVGGCVRDLLLNHKPKDFDIATNATPEQVQKTFRNCRLVGRRFRLAHIMFGRKIIEVATFRGEHINEDDVDNNHTKLDAKSSKRSQAGMLLRDNVYGTIEQDAMRRDFTINGLYYSVKDFSIRDYCNGIEDLKNGVIRLIGDPETRYREDPVRMLRVVRFCAKLNMTIEPQTAAPIKQLAHLLKNIPSPRLFDESLKLLQTGYGYQTYLLLNKYTLSAKLFPTIDKLIFNHNSTEKRSHLSRVEQMIEQTLKNTDYRIANNQRVNPAFLFAAMLWYPLSEHTQEIILESGLTYHDAFDLAMNDILREQCHAISIPKRLTIMMCDIWRLQLRLNKLTPKRVKAVFEHPKFRAAYDLLELRASIEKGELMELAKWWDEYQHINIDQREKMVQKTTTTERKYNKNRKPRNYRSKTSVKKTLINPPN